MGKLLSGSFDMPPRRRYWVMPYRLQCLSLQQTLFFVEPEYPGCCFPAVANRDYRYPIAVV